ncbi:HD domain-containing protein [Thermomicrobium sp. 4228-Ro]|uniref:HD domain-containing protein n=1 Tax=Thermomicrobium sp. 4228-Ro TaxID=2993937 RepID=UPI0022488298|nr:HD domain-containing protein [Thermomicrobium sp. 4228-Ro]MCX2728334.1 HD domain-containing protein [Thermomicrobium sp. 4228-Ro]
MTGLDGWLRFFRLVGRLKTLRRQGWVDRGVRVPESVADHSFRLALMAWLLAQERPGLDAERAALLALAHDVAEALAGDRTPFDAALRAGAERERLFRQRPVYDPESEAKKAAAERAALQELAATLPGSVGTELVTAWEEYEAGQTAEARFVRQLDKLETVLQAFEYRAQQPELIIDSFVLGAMEAVTDPELRRLLEQAIEETKWQPPAEG